MLSRLTRDAAICLNLMKDTSIEFKVASMPSANNLQLGIYAVLNEEERRQVSRRTTAALAAAAKSTVRRGKSKALAKKARAELRSDLSLAALASTGQCSPRARIASLKRG